MEFRDFIVTPLLLLIVYAVAIVIRPYVTDKITRRYFFSALTLRILGALALGFIYQFYYDGGDTYNYHTHGSRHVWNAFMDSPDKGLKLLFFSYGSSDVVGIYEYAGQIPMLKDPSSYNVIRICSVFDLFTFSTYSATAVGFSILSFIGGWLLFLSFYRSHPALHREIALATLFIPSVIFWGSGILKDTVTLSCLGIITFYVRDMFVKGRVRPFSVIVSLIAGFVIFSIKKYILLCYLPAVFIIVFGYTARHIQSRFLRFLVFPLMIFFGVISAYKSVIAVSEDDKRYNVDQLAVTAKITAYDIAFQTGKEAGSRYTIGELDGSLGGMITLAPEAINVSLFRPYLWEVKNPLMLMSAIESAAFLIITLLIIAKYIVYLPRAIANPDVLFCLVFSLTFAFAVGVSTFNFGTLARYKIPLLPFYSLTLIFLYSYSKRERNTFVFDKTE